MLISFSGMFPVWGADEVSLAVGTSVLFLQPLSIPISVKVIIRTNFVKWAQKYKGER